MFHNSTYKPATGKRFSYSICELDRRFQDAVLLSRSRNRAPNSIHPGTFNVWHSADTSPDGGDPGQQSAAASISRITLFRGTQPLCPPYIYTRSTLEVLRANVGRVVPLFPQSTRGACAYTFERWVKIVAVDIIPEGSEELKGFVLKKVNAGGYPKERTQMQWKATFTGDWYKVTVISFDMKEEINPMEAQDARALIEGLQGDE
jgi:hypothetical protein